ncbi:MAG TPA: ABC transporter ATP-binding protein [Candidatus Defluviicoccus seviourii]|mgnify:CR=1 FL=1|nr:ABC transporter ATP-binding protein [Candidatus Defluviicoccus seviourii]
MGLIVASDLAIGPAPGRILARDITFTLEKGEVIAVLGPNGAGKTTLFRTLLALIPPMAGQLELSGFDPATLCPEAIARRLSYVPQAMSAAFPWSVTDFVLMGRSARIGRFATPGRADSAIAAKALSRMGITHLAEAPVTRLSGGERQLALIARALAQESPAILLDEPAAALDFGNRERLAQLLSGLAADGLGLIFSTHEPAQAARLADKVLTIDRAGQAMLGAPSAMLAAERLAALYGLRLAEVQRASGQRAEGCGQIARPGGIGP